jgi:alpha-tubulin suppressor-like RCC1 family protein
MRSIVCVGVVLGTFACSSSSVNDQNGTDGGSGGSAGTTTGGTGGSAGSGGDNDASTGGGGAGGSSGAGGDASTGADCVTQLVAGGYHTCALLSDRTVWCWSNTEQVPAQVESDAEEISAGSAHTCARITGGQVRCWGGNVAGQLGIGNTMASDVPANTGLSAATQISAGGFLSCARAQAKVFCWGDNSAGQVGIGAAGANILAPVEATTVNLTGLSDVIAAGGAGCSRNGADLACWGSNADGALAIGSTDPGPELNPVKIVIPELGIVRSTGRCALTDAGSLWCWGLNTAGQVGDGTNTTRLAPVQVTALGNEVSTMSNTTARTCAVKKDKTAWCWGRNDKGALGNGSTGGSACVDGICESTPVQVVGLNNVKSIVTGNAHSCAALTDGTVWCWGAQPQLGTGAPAQTCGSNPQCEPAPVKTLIQCPQG